MSRCLIVVDMQNDFIDGSLGTSEAQAIIPNVKKKIEEYITRGDEIIFTRDTHYFDYLKTNEGKHLPIKHCTLHTHGWEIHPKIDNKHYLHLDKEAFGYIHWGDWVSHHTKEFEVVGLCTDICVISNVLILKAAFLEAEVTVDASCCAGTSPEKHKAALEVMKSCQINVINE